jgi:hypothetical protein
MVAGPFQGPVRRIHEQFRRGATADFHASLRDAVPPSASNPGLERPGYRQASRRDDGLCDVGGKRHNAEPTRWPWYNTPLAMLAGF